MKLLVDRRWKKSNYTIGRLYIDGVLYCNTLEDKDRGLNQTMSTDYIKKMKVKDQTAIPKGIYKVAMDIISPKFSQYPFYMTTCKGKLPRLLNVKGFDGILIHVGDGPKAQGLTSGCILVGLNKKVGQLSDGKECFEKVYNKLLEAYKRKEEITIEIK